MSPHANISSVFWSFCSAVSLSAITRWLSWLNALLIGFGMSGAYSLIIFVNQRFTLLKQTG